MRAMPLMDRLLSRVEKVTEGGCWIWMGTTTGWSGYGQVSERGRMLLAHRVAYESLVGPIPAGLEVDHLCRVRLCVNPAHLQPVTKAENDRRRMDAQTHCKAGHPRTGPNVRISVKGGHEQRVCRTCVAANMARFKAKPGNVEAMRQYWRDRTAMKRAMR